MVTSLGVKISSLKEERYKYTMKEVIVCLTKFAGNINMSSLCTSSYIMHLLTLTIEKTQKHRVTQGQ